MFFAQLLNLSLLTTGFSWISLPETVALWQGIIAEFKNKYVTILPLYPKTAGGFPSQFKRKVYSSGFSLVDIAFPSLHLQYLKAPYSRTEEKWLVFFKINYIYAKIVIKLMFIKIDKIAKI